MLLNIFIHINFIRYFVINTGLYYFYLSIIIDGISIGEQLKFKRNYQINQDIKSIKNEKHFIDPFVFSKIHEHNFSEYTIYITRVLLDLRGVMYH